VSIGIIAAHDVIGGVTGYAGAVLADSPLFYGRLGEASGTTMTDSSGNGHNGSYTSVTLGATGLLTSSSDTAASFNGTSSFGAVPYGSWMNTATWSVEALFKPSSVSGARTIVTRYTPASYDGVFHLRQDNAAVTLYAFRSASLVTCGATGVTLVNGTIYHVVGTYDGSNLQIYVNGTLKNTITSVTGLNNTTTVNPIGVGRSNNAGSFQEFYSGVIDEVAYYGSALSSTRIAAHYAAI
jgi:hypothetical protein